MTTSGESESDDSEMGRLQGKDSFTLYKKPLPWAACYYCSLLKLIQISLFEHNLAVPVSP